MNNLHELRKKHHLDIDELTYQLNHRFGTQYRSHEIWEWDTYKKSPKMEDAIRLADYFDVSYQEFLDSKMEELKESVDDIQILK